MRKSLLALTAMVIGLTMLALVYAWGWHDARRVSRTEPASLTPSAAAGLSDADVLFLEAMRRGYALDDLIVRRQLVRRMRDTLLQEQLAATPDDTMLRAWLAQHADQYRSPARYSFDQVYLSRGQHGADLQAAAAAVATQLHAAPNDFQRLGDPFPRGKHVERLNTAQIEADFGRALAQAIPTLAPSQWQGPLTSPLGLHFIRVTAIDAARVLTLDQARARLTIDYRQSQAQQRMRDALRRLRADFSGAPPLPAPAPMQDEDMP